MQQITHAFCRWFKVVKHLSKHVKQQTNTFTEDNLLQTKGLHPSRALECLSAPKGPSPGRAYGRIKTIPVACAQKVFGWSKKALEDRVTLFFVILGIFARSIPVFQWFALKIATIRLSLAGLAEDDMSSKDSPKLTKKINQTWKVNQQNGLLLYILQFPGSICSTI